MLVNSHAPHATGTQSHAIAIIPDVSPAENPYAVVNPMEHCIDLLVSVNRLPKGAGRATIQGGGGARREDSGYVGGMDFFYQSIHFFSHVFQLPDGNQLFEPPPRRLQGVPPFFPWLRDFVSARRSARQ